MVEQEILQADILFSTANTSLVQKDKSETFTLQFFDQEIDFRFCELLVFRKKIQQIDIVDLLTNDKPDIEIIRLVHCDKFIVLPIIQILELQELLSGAFTMLELNSLIHKNIVRKVV
ncbi:MAG: hypothetical protein AAFN93_16445 [Bacteroidota bacterium]